MSVLRHLLLLLVAILSMGEARAAIAFGTSASASSGGTNLATATLTINAGNCVMVAVATRFNSDGVLTVKDNNGNAYGTVPLVKTGGIDIAVEIWGVVSAPAATSVNITLNGSHPFTVTVATYTGVLSFGTTATQAETSGNDGTLSMSGMAATTSWMFAGFSSATTGAYGAVTGNLRGSNTVNPSAAAVDNTGATSETCAVSRVSAFWCAASIELSLSPVMRKTIGDPPGTRTAY